MMSPENIRERYSDPLDTFIRSALQEEVSSMKLPCAWKQIKKRVWQLKRERQVMQACLSIHCAESTQTFSNRADILYFLISNSAFRIIR